MLCLIICRFVCIGGGGVFHYCYSNQLNHGSRAMHDGKAYLSVLYYFKNILRDKRAGEEGSDKCESRECTTGPLLVVWWLGLGFSCI